MISHIFYVYLNMSIIGSIIAIILLIIRSIFGKVIPRKFIYSIWAIVLFRLLIPISLSSKWSIINIIDSYNIKSITIPNNQVDIFSYTNTIQVADNYFPIKYKTQFMTSFFNITSLIWLIGIIVIGIIAFIMYRITIKKLMKAKQTDENNDVLMQCMNVLKMKGKILIYKGDFIQTPAVIGLVKPIIIIPNSVDNKELKYIILHELCHINRKDQLWKVLTIIAVCIHWYNPFVWLLFYIADRDMEMSCDEKVLNNIQNNEKKEYATALMNMACAPQFTVTAFGSTAIKARILNIVHYRKLPLYMIIIMTIVCIIITILLITNPTL
jgi:beta-lactamase regulating signal transducer with metallopeptidase domain